MSKYLRNPHAGQAELLRRQYYDWLAQVRDRPPQPYGITPGVNARAQAAERAARQQAVLPNAPAPQPVQPPGQPTQVVGPAMAAVTGQPVGAAPLSMPLLEAGWYQPAEVAQAVQTGALEAGFARSYDSHGHANALPNAPAI